MDFTGNTTVNGADYDVDVVAVYGCEQREEGIKIWVFKLTLDRTTSKVMFCGGALGTAETNVKERKMSGKQTMQHINQYENTTIALMILFINKKGSHYGEKVSFWLYIQT